MKKSGHNIFKLFYNIVTKYPTPGALNYAWNFGVLALLALGVQIITGIVLAMYYTPHVDFAFFSVERIMRDINYGYILRGLHATGASFFFIVIYLHILRGIFYGSYQFPRYGLWISGIIIFFVMIITAFLGYLLPWGQMSFWGGTVITNLATILPTGDKIVEILWGAYSVSNPTLNKFFALHFVMPFILMIFVTLHLIFLHTTGSNNALGISSNSDKIFFSPYYIVKDLFTVIIFFIFYFFFTIFNSELLSDPDNFIPANPLVTPPHIVPEWYFLPFYAILRCIPNKTLGVLGLLASIILLGLLPFIHKSSVRILNFKIILYFITLLAALSFLNLMNLGSKPISELFITAAWVSIAFYSMFFVVLFMFDTLKSKNFYFYEQKSIRKANMLKNSIWGIFLWVGFLSLSLGLLIYKMFKNKKNNKSDDNGPSPKSSPSSGPGGKSKNFFEHPKTNSINIFPFLQTNFFIIFFKKIFDDFSEQKSIRKISVELSVCLIFCWISFFWLWVDVSFTLPFFKKFLIIFVPISLILLCAWLIILIKYFAIFSSDMQKNTDQFFITKNFIFLVIFMLFFLTFCFLFLYKFYFIVLLFFSIFSFSLIPVEYLRLNQVITKNVFFSLLRSLKLLDFFVGLSLFFFDFLPPTVSYFIYSTTFYLSLFFIVLVRVFFYMVKIPLAVGLMPLSSMESILWLSAIFVCTFALLFRFLLILAFHIFTFTLNFYPDSIIKIFPNDPYPVKQTGFVNNNYQTNNYYNNRGPNFKGFTSYGRTGLVLGIIGTAGTLGFGYVTYQHMCMQTTLAQQSVDQNEVSMGRMSRETYEQKYPTKKNE